MAITKDSGRQYPVVARVEFALADLASGVAAPAIDIPSGSVVLRGMLVFTTAFNSGTSDACTVGDGGSAARYATIAAGSGALSANLYKVITPTGYQYTANDSIDIVWTAVGTAATTGAGYLEIEYMTEGKSNENFDM